MKNVSIFTFLVITIISVPTVRAMEEERPAKRAKLKQDESHYTALRNRLSQYLYSPNYDSQSINHRRAVARYLSDVVGSSSAQHTLAMQVPGYTMTFKQLVDAVSKKYDLLRVGDSYMERNVRYGSQE